MQDERLKSIKAMSAFANTEVNIRPLVDKWILLTYDLLVTKAGEEARSKFLANARRIGAVKHTNSVYLMPWTPQAELAALQVAAIGDAYLWISEAKDMAQLTKEYDKKTDVLFDEIEERLDKIEGHLIQDHPGIATRMLDKTGPMIDSLVEITTNRGNVDSYERVAKLKDKYIFERKRL